MRAFGHRVGGGALGAGGRGGLPGGRSRARAPPARRQRRGPAAVARPGAASEVVRDVGVCRGPYAVVVAETLAQARTPPKRSRGPDPLRPVTDPEAGRRRGRTTPVARGRHERRRHVRARVGRGRARRGRGRGAGPIRESAAGPRADGGERDRGRAAGRGRRGEATVWVSSQVPFDVRNGPRGRSRRSSGARSTRSRPTSAAASASKLLIYPEYLGCAAARSARAPRAVGRDALGGAW